MLLQLPFVCSLHAQSLTRSFPHRELQITLRYPDGAAAATDSAVRSVVSRGLDAWHKLFGGWPLDAQRRPYRAVRIELQRAAVTGGTTDPALVRVTLGKDSLFGLSAWQLTLLHELFHLWNGESFQYETDGEQWFHEGVAEFYTLQTAARLGMIKLERVPSAFAANIGWYLTAPDRGRVSLREAGRTSPIPNGHFVLVHHGGFTASLLFDGGIRNSTQGRRSLDDLMRWFYQRHDASRHRYDLDDIAAGLKAMGAGDYRAELDRWVVSAEGMPPALRWMYGYFEDLSAQIAKNGGRLAKELRADRRSTLLTLGIADR